MPVLLLALLVGTTAAAQPLSPVRERVERHVTLPTGAKEAVPEVHVARGALTTLVFDAPVEKASLELEKRVSRFRLVDVGESTLNLEPLVDLAPEERLGLRIRLKDGSVVALVLTSHPARVDGRVDVNRVRPAEELRAELAATKAELAALKAQVGTNGPASWVLAGLLDELLIQRLDIQVAAGNASGLSVEAGTGYRSRTWTVVAIRLRNLPGQKPWAPGQARLLRRDGRPVQVLSVQLAKPVLAPGERGTVAVQTGAPDWEWGETFHLELTDKDGGRVLSIEGVTL
jgi:uncharacterized protein (TIGR02268 family)